MLKDTRQACTGASMQSYVIHSATGVFNGDIGAVWVSFSAAGCGDTSEMDMQRTPRPGAPESACS